jgi:hypothetical protein
MSGNDGHFPYHTAERKVIVVVVADVEKQVGERSPANAPLYLLCPPSNCSTDCTVPVFTAMPDFSATREVLSMAQVPSGIESTGDTTIEWSAAAAIGRCSADLRWRAKN